MIFALRSLVLAALTTSFVATAPFQCGGGSKDVPHEDSAGDALYKLAQDFKAKGNEQASKDTLRYLVQHYPSNRHVPAARIELGEGDLPPAPAPSASASASAASK
jgi:TolA-binding protein